MRLSIPAAVVAAVLAVCVSGCQNPPAPPATEKPLPVNAAPAAGAATGPIAVGPDETDATLLAKKDAAPPYVKIRRDKDGKYTWDISGKDVGDILKADKALRKSLGSGDKK